MGFREDRDDMDSGFRFQEFFNGETEDGFALQFEELLGNGSAHAGTGSAGGDNHEFFSLHHAFLLRKCKFFFVILMA